MKKIILFIYFLVLISPRVFGQNYERYKTLLDTSITSKNLGFNKKISITVPFEWQKELNRDFPLIIIFDRQNQKSHQYIINTIDYLTSTEQMPSSIIVSVESEQQYRYKETLYKESSKDGLGLANEKFLFEELIPLMENHYKASKFRLFIGHSRYGYFTTSLLNARINELNAVIALSPFFTQTNIDLTDSLAKLNNQKLQSHKYYYYAIGNDYPADFAKMDAVTKKLNNTLFHTKGFHFKEADHNATPGLAISISLYEIFEKYSNIQSKYFSNDQTELSIIPSLEKEILSSYGSNLAFSLGILNGKGWFFYNKNEFDKAIEAWEILVKSYPNFSEGYLYIIDAQKQLKKDFSLTATRFKNSISKSDIYSEKEKEELLKELENLIK